MKSVVISVFCLCLIAGPATEAGADVTRYAIVVGNNRAPDDQPALSPLRYADDDAVRFHQFAERLGAESTLLTVLDQDTQRRYPALPIVARPPTRENLDHAVNAVAINVARDIERGDVPVFYFIFAGHGAVLEGSPYFALSDDRITQRVLYEEIIERIDAETIHLIIDACHASGVVGSRGMFEREVTGTTVDVPSTEVAGLTKLSQYPNVGVLLAATLGEESHEWSRIQSGVFSHEILSGLSGPADVNRDGRIEYSEIHAFVAAANRDLRDRRTAPQVIARPPDRDHHLPLVRLPDQRDVAWLQGNATPLGHFHIERESGQRYLDAHIASAVPVRLAIPSGETLYVRSATEEARVQVGTGQIVRIEDLDFEQPESVPRGVVEAEFHARLFATPFNAVYYQGFVDRGNGVSVRFDQQALLYDVPAPPNRKRIAIGLFSAAGASAAAALVSGGIMIKAKRDFDSTELQADAADANETFENARTATIVSASVSVVSAIAGAVTWPKKRKARFGVTLNPKRRNYALQAEFAF
ncbi:MAG: caspase family protein [Myxococcota bacterium]